MSDDEDSRLVIDDAATTPTTTPSLPPLAAAAAPQPAASSAAISPVLAPKDSNGTVAPPSSVASASTASESVKEEGELEEDDDAEARSSKTANASTAPDEKSPPKASPSETVDEKKELSVETTLPVKASPTSLISPGRTPATKVSPGRSRARQLDVPLNGEAMSPRARIGVVRKRKDSGSDEKRDGKSPAKKTSRVDKATCVKWTQCGGSEEEEESFFDLRTGAQALLDVTVMCKTDSHTMYIVAKWRGEELTGVITDGQPPAFHSYMKKRTMNGSSSSTESGEKAPSGSSTPSKGRTKEKEKEKEKRAGRSSSVSEGKAQKRLLAAATSAMSSKSEAGGDTPDEDWDPVTPRTPLRLVEVASALSLHECPREECGHKYERASELQFHLATMHCKKVVMKESLGSQTDLSGLSSVSVATDVDDLNKTIKLTPLEEESLQGLFKTARKAEKQDGGRASHYSDISDDGAPQLQKEEPPEQPSAFSEASQTIKTEVKKEQCLPLASASPAALPSSFQPPAEKPRPSISAVAPHVNSGFLPSRGLGEGSLLPPSAFGLAGTSYPYLLPGAPPFQRPPVAAGVASPVARPPGADERHKIHELKTIAKSEVPSSSSSTTVDTKCLPSPAHSMQQRMGLSLMHPALQQQQQAQAQAQAQAAQQQQQMQQQHVQQQMQQMQLMQQLMRGSIPGIQSPEMLMLMMQQNQHMFPK